jgi:hypothetical protein
MAIILLDSGVLGNLCNPYASPQRTELDNWLYGLMAHRLDADLIICATAQSLAQKYPGRNVIVATTNVKHLSRFVAAATWQEITL